MSVELSSEQVVRKVGFDLELKIIIMIQLCIWPGCECPIFPPLSFIILLKPCYEQDVCFTLFCLPWWKSDNILLSSKMKQMSVTNYNLIMLQVDLMSYTTVGM
jgi:hypothetical protein